MANPLRILAPCIDWTRAAGGVRKLYRHVDVLNAAGIEAIVMHQQPGFRCTWFENQTRVSSYEQVGTPRQGDIFLVPEVLAWQFVTLWPGFPKVIFSQNAYQTFSWKQDEHTVSPYTHPEFKAVIVVSEDSRAYLQYTYPTLKNIHRIRYGIDPTQFFFDASKKRQIAYMPRKLEQDARQVLAVLKYKGLLNNWDIVKIEDKTESETARILRETAIFLSLSTQEGWGLPPMEAMACGCLTIGYDGRGGAEFFKPPHATPIDFQNIPAFAAAVEQAIHDIDSTPQQVWDRTRQSAHFIAENYSPQIEAADIVATWTRILESI